MPVIEITVADWEIECCAPPPVVGGTTSWCLGFRPDDLAPEDVWTVTHVDRAVLLERDGIVAAWAVADATPPPPGIHRLRGRLTGTRHGGLLPEDLPEVTGRVERIRLVSYEYVADPAEPRALTYVAESRALRDVRESPRWFNPGQPIGPGRMDTGLLLDVAVRA
jgi:hypothetical protein